MIKGKQPKQRAKFWEKPERAPYAPLTAAGKARRREWPADWQAQLSQLASAEQEQPR